MFLFTIIVPVYQEFNIFRLFFNSLCLSIEHNTQIVLINDNSGDAIGNYLNEVSSNLPHQCMVNIITHKTNLGCAKCINEAFPLIKGEYTVIMDSDIILPAEWQSSILKTFQLSTKICVGGILLYPQTGGIQNCGITYTRALGRHLFLNSKPNRLKKYGIYEIQSTVFAFFCAPTSIIQKAGLINEDFFNGYEDLDYQMRIRKLGVHILINPEIQLYHWEQSNGIHRSQNRKSNLGLFWAKHANNVISDLWKYLFFEFQNCGKLHSQYIGIDLSGNRMDANDFWRELQKRYPDILLSYIDCSHWIKDLEQICIPKVTTIDLFKEKKPFIFLCDNFVQLVNNYYWHSLRKNYCKDDIIIDLYGNVIKFEDIALYSWPGQKIR